MSPDMPFSFKPFRRGRHSMGLDRFVQASTADAIVDLKGQVPTPYGAAQDLAGSRAQCHAIRRQQCRSRYFPRIARIAAEYPDRALGVVVAADGGCPPLPSVFEDRHPSCDQPDRGALAGQNDASIHEVIIAAHWIHYFENDDAMSNVHHTSRNQRHSVVGALL